ncbi:MAG: response regulator [Elusimicrobia bacterium]|jgi:DNA-binding NtrC family response regulator|nr:response regulator [Elusimicrobiota bacterium]
MIKILVCDDEIFARDAMARIIKRKGFDVVVASNGEECIELFKKENPEVVFLDVMLPDLDGDHIHRYLKELKKDVNVYYITGSATVFTKENAEKEGAKGYLQKPVDMDILFETLDSIKKDFGEQN